MAILKWSEKKIAELVKEGRGSSVMGEYIPWITARDFSSKGFGYRILGTKTGRKHDLLSGEEYAFFLRSEWSSNVVDIQEQYPLSDRNLTQTLASELKVNHPHYQKTDVPLVMTTDFLLTLSDGEKTKKVAVDVKTSKDVDNPRTLEKLEIARSYLEVHGIEHKVMLDYRMDQNTTRNLNWLYLEQRRVGIDTGVQTEDLQPIMVDWLNGLNERGYAMKLRDLARHFDDLVGQRRGTGLSVMRALMNKRSIPVVLTCPDILDLTWAELLNAQRPEAPRLKAA
jgi:hypothetical protein